MDNFFLKMILLTSQKGCHQGEILSLQQDGQNRKMVIESNLSLSLTATSYPFLDFLKGFKKSIFIKLKIESKIFDLELG